MAERRAARQWVGERVAERWRRAAKRLAFLVAPSMVVALCGFASALVEAPRASAQAPLPPPRGAFAGVPPRAEGVALLIATDYARASDLALAVRDAGCDVEALFVLRSSPEAAPAGAAAEWAGYIPSAPAAVNDPFERALPVIPPATPFFLRCRGAVAPHVDPANARYLIEGVPVTLVNGRFESPPAQPSKVVTVLTERQAYGELDGQLARADAAVVLAHTTTEGGTRSYLGVQPGGTPGSVVGPTVGLGNVLVEGIEVAHGRIVVTYVEGDAPSPLGFPTSPRTTKVFALQGNALVEVGSLGW